MRYESDRNSQCAVASTLLALTTIVVGIILALGTGGYSELLAIAVLSVASAWIWGFLYPEQLKRLGMSHTMVTAVYVVVTGFLISHVFRLLIEELSGLS